MEKDIKELDQFDSVAFLRSEKFQNIGYVVRNGRVYFQFENTPELNQALISFYNNTIKVHPYAFSYQLRQVTHLAKEILKGVNPNGK